MHTWVEDRQVVEIKITVFEVEEITENNGGREDIPMQHKTEWRNKTKSSIMLIKEGTTRNEVLQTTNLRRAPSNLLK